MSDLESPKDAKQKGTEDGKQFVGNKELFSRNEKKLCGQDAIKFNASLENDLPFESWPGILKLFGLQRATPELRAAIFPSVAGGGGSSYQDDYVRAFWDQIVISGILNGSCGTS